MGIFVGDACSSTPNVDLGDARAQFNLLWRHRLLKGSKFSPRTEDKECITSGKNDLTWFAIGDKTEKETQDAFQKTYYQLPTYFSRLDTTEEHNS